MYLFCFVLFSRNMFPPNIVEACTKQVTVPLCVLPLSLSPNYIKILYSLIAHFVLFEASGVLCFCIFAMPLSFLWAFNYLLETSVTQEIQFLGNYM